MGRITASLAQVDEHLYGPWFGPSLDRRNFRGKMEVFVKSQISLRCARCREEIIPANIRTVYQMVDYHRHCFLMLVREEAEQQIRIRSSSAGVGQAAVEVASTK